MKKSVIAFGIALSTSGIILATAGTASAWSVALSGRLCTPGVGESSTNIISATGGWTFYQSTASHHLQCGIVDTSVTPIGNTTGVWIYGTCSNNTGSGIQARFCAKPWYSNGYTCGPYTQLTNTQCSSPFYYELGLDTSARTVYGSYYIDVVGNGSWEIEGIWLQG